MNEAFAFAVGVGFLGLLTWGVIVIGVTLLYSLPSIIAINRKHKNTMAIFLINILLSWTVIGYIVALIWSFSNNVYKENELV